MATAAGGGRCYVCRWFNTLRVLTFGLAHETPSFSEEAGYTGPLKGAASTGARLGLLRACILIPSSLSYPAATEYIISTLLCFYFAQPPLIMLGPADTVNGWTGRKK